MPAYEFAFPPGVTSLKAVKGSGPNGVPHEYPLVVGTDTFTRTGIDGAEVILPLFGGDEFVGEVLEGQWVKGWDANISTFIAKIASGALNLGGVAAVAGTGGVGWIDGQYPCVLMDEAEFTVELEVPVDDTGAVADRDIDLEFHLTKNKLTTTPIGDTDSLYIKVDVDETGILMSLVKRVASAATTIFDGSTYDDASARATGTGQFTIWRLVFSESHSLTAYRHVHVYLKQADSFVNAEAATENELTTSPYDVSGLLFKTAYPAYRLYTQNVTYFDSANRAVSQYVRASYPDFTLPYDCPAANLGLGEVKLFDTMGSAVETDWQRVRGVDHKFTGDTVIQNGLIRLYIDNLANSGLKAYLFSAAAWVQTHHHTCQLTTSAVWCLYPKLVKIQKITPEEAIITVALLDSAVDNDDYAVTFTGIIGRGRYLYELNLVSSHPIEWILTSVLLTNPLYAFCQDEQVADSGVHVSATNTTISDNSAVAFDVTHPILIIYASTIKQYLASYEAQNIYNNLLITIYPDVKEYWGAIPLLLVANLFKEAESATISGAAREWFNGTGTDTVTENNAAWTPNANTTENENDTTRVSVGAKNVKWTSVAAGACLSDCLDAPASNNSLLKFDFMKLYLSRSGVTNPATVTITLYDDDGDSLYIAQAITNAAVQYSIPLPHSATDLQGWTQVGTYDWAKHDHLRIGWTALGAGEIVYLDGLHFYIGTTTARGRGETLSGASAAVLDAQNEFTSDDILGITNLPAGRYLLVIRAKDTDQVASDLNLRAYNATDALYLNEDGAATAQTLTAAFTYKAIAFDIRASESGDTINLKVLKSSATENTIFVDCFLLIPIGNGQSFPQDLSHSCLRRATRARTVYER